MKNKVLTFSVAAFNIEKYLDKLMNSIIDSGRINDLEILIVNDGSTDLTETIGMKYQTLYPNSIKLITKENGGHGSTINTGIENATGKYFRPIDGDDWVDSKNISLLIDKLEDEYSDLIICPFIRYYESDGKKELVDQVNLEFDTLYSLELDKNVDLYGLVYHNIFFKTELFKNNNVQPLERHCFYVDNEYICYPLLYCHTVKQYNLPIYVYRLGREGQSVSKESLWKHYKEHQMVVSNIAEYYITNEQNMNVPVKSFIRRHVARLMGEHIHILLSFPLSYKSLKRAIDYKEQIENNYNDFYKEINYKTIQLWMKAPRLLYLPVYVKKLFKQ